MRIPHEPFLKRFLGMTVLAVVFLLALCCSSSDGDKLTETNSEVVANQGAGETIKIDDSYPQQVKTALKEAKDKSEIIMVEVYSGNCPTCVEMEKVLGKAVVKKALADVVHVRLQPDEARRIIDAFGLTIVSSFLFFKPSGEFIPKYLDGYRSSKRFAAEIENFKLIAKGQPPKKLKPDRHPRFGKG